MIERILIVEYIDDFRNYLIREEKSAATIEKYIRDVGTFFRFLNGQNVEKEQVISYKKSLEERGYAVRSINSMLASVNNLLEFLNWGECKVKMLRCQRLTYCSEEKELSKAEYKRLLEASRKQERLNLVIQTICSTGIRVSELKYFTVDAVKRGEISVRCKSKIRTILVPGKLRRLLLDYSKRNNIKQGIIFVTKNGNPLDRSNIWSQMKALCKSADVNPEKVFPHNLRKLFARTFYGIEKDIAKLADILGHGSIETTRIYIMTTGTEHRQKMEQLGLVDCLVG